MKNWNTCLWLNTSDNTVTLLEISRLTSIATFEITTLHCTILRNNLALSNNSDLTCNNIGLLLKVIDARFSINYIWQQYNILVERNLESRQFAESKLYYYPSSYKYIFYNQYIHILSNSWTRSHISTYQIIFML